MAKIKTVVSWGCVVLGLGLAGLPGCAASGDGTTPGGDDDDDIPGGTADAGTPGEEIPPENMIDDLDDGDGLLLTRGGRVGSWYTYNDKSETGEQTPAAGVAFLPSPGGATSGGFCATTSGGGFSVWGAGMGLDLNNPDGEKAVYDASMFHGVRFKARGTVPIRAAVMIAGVISAEVGGSCVAGAGTGQGCDDGHGRLVVLSPEWKSYDLPFAQITQAGWGKPVVFDATQIMSIQFNVEKNLAFDVSIDDVGFF
jgi:hypothetical protein